MNKLKTSFLFVSLLAATSLCCKDVTVVEGINLIDYKPFTFMTKAVSLKEKSNLKIESDLPQLDGALALYPVYSAFVMAVYPDKDYSRNESEVLCSNTRRAYDKLINGNADIIFVAPPSQEQLNDAKKAKVNFRFTPIGKEAFVFFVNSKNPVTSLTVEQIKNIYSGKITNWKEVGGKDEDIQAFQRNANSGSQTAFVAFMKGTKIMTPPQENVQQMMGGIIAVASDYKNHGNSIGFSFRFFVNEMVKNRGIKMLKVNGVSPELETIADGTYPLAAEFFALSLTSNNKPNVLKFLDWMQSKQGQYLVEKTGYSPLIKSNDNQGVKK